MCCLALVNPDAGGCEAAKSDRPCRLPPSWNYIRFVRFSVDAREKWWEMTKKLPVKRVAIAFIVDRHKVHHHHVHGLRIQAADAHLEGREHATTRFGDDHFGALLVELVPQLLRFEDDDGLGERRMGRWGRSSRSGSRIDGRCGLYQCNRI